MALSGAAAVSMRSGVGDLPRLRHRNVTVSTRVRHFGVKLRLTVLRTILLRVALRSKVTSKGL